MMLPSVIAIAMMLLAGDEQSVHSVRSLAPVALKHRASAPQPHVDFFVATN